MIDAKPEAAPKKPERRVSRADLVKVRKMADQLAEKQKEYRNWVEESCDTIGCYADQWRPRLGYWVDEHEKRNKVAAGFTKEARNRLNRLELLSESLGRKVRRIAEAHGVTAKEVDIQSGVIQSEGKAVELEEVLKDADTDGRDDCEEEREQ